ncbi:MAG: 30S ribosomal protein S20 [Desulfomonilaceae bacterium]
MEALYKLNCAKLILKEQNLKGAINDPSALKRMRQNEKKRIRNISYKSKVKTSVKKYLKAAEEKTAEAGNLLNATVSLLSKGVTKGIFHKNTASRTISRLSRKLAV